MIIDDFLAKGGASLGLIELVNKANANLSGVGIVIEKGFQEGGQLLRERGVDLQSLAIVDRFIDGNIRFLD